MLPVGLYGTLRVFSLSASNHSSIQSAKHCRPVLPVWEQTPSEAGSVYGKWKIMVYVFPSSAYVFILGEMSCHVHCDAKITASVLRDVAHDRAVQMLFCLVVFRRKWREEYLLTVVIQTMFVLLNRNVWSQVSDVLLKWQEWELRKAAMTSDLSSFIEQGLWLGLPGSAEKNLFRKITFSQFFFYTTYAIWELSKPLYGLAHTQ